MQLLRWKLLVSMSVFAAASAVACGGGSQSGNEGTTIPPSASSDAPTPDGPVPARPRIVALGDSLTAGLGLSPDQAYPALLQTRINERGLNYEVVSAGVSGDTSAGGLRRLDWVLQGDVRVLIIALGGNDGLRGLPIDALQSTLGQIVERAQDRNIDVLLAGMEAPPNLGPVYVNGFRQVYRDLAEEYDVVLVPFMLAGVAGVEQLNQPDGIHPNVEGTRMVADLIWEALLPMLDDAWNKPAHETHASGS